MSTDQGLEPRLRVWLHERLTERPDPYPILEEVLSQLPTTPQRRHRWWPFGRGASPSISETNSITSTGRFTMFSALKFVTAAVIVALFGGFLLTGILTTPEEKIAPAIVAESPSPMTTDELAFPTGTFVAKEDGLTLEFRLDGTCQREGVPCTYGVSGNLFSEMTFEEPTGPQKPATYYWDYDGESLTFEPWGIDQRPSRGSIYADHVYRPIGETLPLRVADPGFPIGRFVPADGSGAPTVSFREGAYGSSTGGGNSKYVVNGNLFTEMKFVAEGYEKVPATYYWDYDGERLTFRLWGEDDFAPRKSLLLGRVYVEDPSATVLGDMRRLLLSHPQLDLWVTVEIVERDDGSSAATATTIEGPLGEGIGETAQEAVEAALQPLGEPYASDMARSVEG